MVGVLVFNVMMVLLGVGILSRVVPAKPVIHTLTVLHNLMGITRPTPENVRTVALIWIGAVIVIGDGMLFLLVFLASAVRS